MDRQKFSVAMSVYGKDNPIWFKTAVDSILNQTMPPDEVVLVVDGPVPEELSQVICGYEQRPDFKVVWLPENRGLGCALKTAVAECSHNIIARMDSDDIAVPTRFAEQLRLFSENTDVDVVGGDISEFVGEEENVVAYRCVPKTDMGIKSYLKKRCPMNHVTVMFKKSAVQAAGDYRDLFWNEDYYLWIRMAEHNAVMANTGTVLVNVRTGKDMYNRRGGKCYFQSELFLQNYMLKRKIIDLPTYLSNVAKRWIIQCLLPNQVRGWVFQKFARVGGNQK